MAEAIDGNTWRLRAPDDGHCHLRDYAWELWAESHPMDIALFGGDKHNRLPVVFSYTAAQFKRAIAMPNTDVPIMTAPMALAYRERISWIAKMSGFDDFEPLLVIYITPATTPQQIFDAKNAGVVAGKFYPRHGTTGSGHGIPDFGELMYPVYEAMQRCGMLALFHGADPNPDVDIYDKEAAFIPVFLRIREAFPDLIAVFEHMSTAAAVDCVLESENTYGTICPQHLHWTRNDMMGAGLNPAAYCFPPLQRASDRSKLVKAATSGLPHFFAGTDSAPHFANTKYCEGGCMGAFVAPHAMELYAEIFEDHAGADWVDRLEAFSSEFFAKAYGLALNQGCMVLRREEWQIPERIGKGERCIVPFRPGETLRFKAQRVVS